MSFQHTADPMAAAGQGGALAACLLDFESFPGRYALALREPRLLFDRGTEVLMLAGGRAVEGLPQDPALAERLRTAARFFVRAGLLRSGVDHYTLLGLVPGCTAAQVRDHYRLLMRLTHPDFAGDGQDWPADAATRINQANDVLSSPERRRDYDRTLPRGRQWEPSSQISPAVPLPRQAPRPFPPRPGGAVVRRSRKLPVVVAVLAVSAAGWWLLSGQEPEGLSVAAIPQPQPKPVAAPPKHAPVQVPAVAPAPAPAPAPVVVAQARVLPAPVERSVPVAQALAPVPAPAARPPVPVEPPVKTPVATPAARPAEALARPEAGSPRPAAQPPAPAVKVAAPVARDPLPHVAPPPPRPAVAPATASTSAPAPATAAARRPPEEDRLGLRPATTLASVYPAPAPVAAVAEPRAPAASPPPPVAAVPARAPVTAPAVVPATAPPPVVTPAPAVAPVTASAPPAASPGPSAPTAARTPAARVTMAEVQPLLGHLLDVLGSGRGEQINRLIDRSGRDGAGADGFVQTYNRVVANGGKVRLGPVQFSGRQEGDALAVDGVVMLMLQDENRQPVTRELVLKALFASRGGQPVMTQVTASELAR